MNTTHQVLEEIARVERHHEHDEQAWAQLVRDWRGARSLPLVWLAMFVFFAVFDGIVFSRQTGVTSLVYLAPTAFLAITSPLMILGPRRREKALLAIIAREAPELARKLESEGIR